MSAAQSQSRLDALECHFTWDLDLCRFKLLCLKDMLEDIGTEEGYSWLGHIYNLQGYIHYQLGSTEDARRFFGRAAEAFRQMRNTVSEEGPWLVVNYGNLAWLHHHLGDQAESESYLSKVDALMTEYPSPSQDELHPEICAEKAWTLMKFSKDKRQKAVDYFQRAIRMQPDRVEWHTSHVIALVNASTHHRELPANIFEKMQIAKQHDPENLYLAVLYLEACAKKGQNVQSEARELARMVLRKPVSSYSGIKPLLKLYRKYVSLDEAIDLAEEALERHPDEPLLKMCAAVCYKMRIFLDKDSPLEHSIINRAIALHQEVISLYPNSALKHKIALANIYAELRRHDEAEEVFTELLQSGLDPAGSQILYNCYAKYLHFHQQGSRRSAEYHMKAAEIPIESYYRVSSISLLRTLEERNTYNMGEQIGEFLANLHD